MQPPGQQMLRKLCAQQRGLFIAVAVFSFAINMLMLTGPLYMMQVYDRVLSSRSHETLVALSMIALFLFVMMGVFDFVRGAVLARVGVRLQTALDHPVFRAVLDHARSNPKAPPHPGPSDVEALHRLAASPAVHALFDLPWVPVFLIALFAFHPALFTLAIAGGAVLIVASIANQRAVKAPTRKGQAALHQSDRQVSQAIAQADLIRASGMDDAVFKRWHAHRDQSVTQHLTAQDRGGSLVTLSKALRLILQSAMLGLGAWLVIDGALSAGAMIAASVLLGRALAPIEALIGQAAMLQRGRMAWSSLVKLLNDHPPKKDGPSMAPRAVNLRLDQVTVIPPGERKAVLRMISFDLRGGDACGVIGPSGAGKSCLARTVTGLWAPAAGTVHIGGVPIDKIGDANLGSLIGYVPQSVSLFDGTIAENIARLRPDPDMKAVAEAARTAGVSDIIERLPDGYGTVVNPDRMPLSGGEVQRLGLARALYGNPMLIVLDEPNANLDNAGTAALNETIRSLRRKERIIIVIAHRPASIQECNVLLMIEDGTRKAFGPKENVLRKVVKNHATVERPNTRAGLR